MKNLSIKELEEQRMLVLSEIDRLLYELSLVEGVDPVETERLEELVVVEIDKRKMFDKELDCSKR